MNSVAMNEIVLKKRGTRRERVQFVLWLLLAPIAVYAPKATVIWLCLIVILAPDIRTAISMVPAYSKNWVVRALALFLIWAAISLLWSPEPARGAAAVAKLTGLSLIGLLSVAAARASVTNNRRLAAMGIIGFVVFLVAILGFEILSGAKVAFLVKGANSNALTYLFATNGSAILSLFALTSAALVAIRMATRWQALAVFGLSCLVIAPLPMFAALIGLVLAALVFAFVWVGGKRALYCVITIAVGFVFIQPAVWNKDVALGKTASRVVEVPTSWQHRILIWEFVSQKSMQRPLLGHGFDTSRVIGRTTEKGIVVGKTSSWGESVLPLHPHSLGLQLWLELGGIGVLLAMGVLIAIGREIASFAADRFLCAALAGSLAIPWFIASVSFGAWQSWWIAALWLSATAAMILVEERARERVS